MNVTSLLLSSHLFTLPLVNTQYENFEHPVKFLHEHREIILALSSDEEALEVHQSFRQKLRIPAQPSTLRKPSISRQTSELLSHKIQATITTFWAAMATIAHIQKLHAKPDIPLDFHFLSDTLPTDTQQRWIDSKLPLVKFKNLLKVQKKLSMVPPEKPIAFPLGDDYAQFTNFHDQSTLTHNRSSWTTLLNNLGFQGIEARLHEYWQQPDQQSVASNSDPLKQAYIQQYIASRLFPVFYAYVLTLAIEVEKQVYEKAWETWHRLGQLQQRKQINHAKMRLCGTWKWIIHNHQNHGDYKTTMTFPPPGPTTPSQAQPTTILMYGDAVYLKWTFPQGFQEDSLLFSNQDLRLEGTFMSSLGPHGSISGQRISPCQE